MSCVPSLKIKKFAKSYIKTIKSLGNHRAHFDDNIKFIVMKLIEHSIKTNGVQETASFVYHFFPNTIVEKILAHLDEPLCKPADCPDIEVLTDDNFNDEVDTNESKWLINFYSNKCSHCNDFAPIWKRLPAAIGSNNDIRLGEISLESGSNIFKRYNIESTPSIVLLHRDDFDMLVSGSFNLENVLDFIEHPGTYNDRTDDEIDCSNIIKHLNKVFTKASVDKNYLRSHFRFQNARINAESVLVKLR